MDESILVSIKKLLGLAPDYDIFDMDIKMYINSVLMALHQMGVGPEEALIVTDPLTKWSDFIGDRTDLEAVKTYVYLRVKMLFDPPQSSSVMEAQNKIADEYAWRLYSKNDYGVDSPYEHERRYFSPSRHSWNEVGNP